MENTMMKKDRNAPFAVFKLFFLYGKPVGKGAIQFLI